MSYEADAAELQSSSVTEYTDYEIEDRYRDMLNDCYGDVDICGQSFQSGTALEELDPTAFRCGCNDYTDSDETIVEIDGCYFDADEVREYEEEKEAEEEAEEEEAEEAEQAEQSERIHEKYDGECPICEEGIDTEVAHNDACDCGFQFLDPDQ